MPIKQEKELDIKFLESLFTNQASFTFEKCGAVEKNTERTKYCRKYFISNLKYLY
jgi:hypothetical protein